jgi:hypothetical protein
MQYYLFIFALKTHQASDVLITLPSSVAFSDKLDSSDPLLTAVLQKVTFFLLHLFCVVIGRECNGLVVVVVCLFEFGIRFPPKKLKSTFFFVFVEFGGQAQADKVDPKVRLVLAALQEGTKRTSPYTAWLS